MHSQKTQYTHRKHNTLSEMKTHAQKTEYTHRNENTHRIQNTLTENTIQF